MSLIRLHNVTMKYEDRLVLRSVFFRLQPGERVGLIGKNGTGKTTILKLILGEITPTEGTVEHEPGLKIGYFSQFSSLDGRFSVQQTLEALFADLKALEQQLAEIALALETVEDAGEMERLLERQSLALDEMNHKDGWEYPRRIDTVLTKLGFSQEHRERPIEQLSGGWRNRAALAKILLEQPDVLLLDEPTNYLDVAGLAWLEGWLSQFRGGLILVSHDRQFLDGVVTRMIEVENYGFQEYLGKFSDYVREKQFRLKTLERQFLHEEELLMFEPRQSPTAKKPSAIRRTLCSASSPTSKNAASRARWMFSSRRSTAACAFPTSWPAPSILPKPTTAKRCFRRFVRDRKRRAAGDCRPERQREIVAFAAADPQRSAGQRRDGLGAGHHLCGLQPSAGRS